MIYVPDRTYGLATQIKKIQTVIDPEFSNVWDSPINIYNLLYENHKNDGLVLEAHLNNEEYKQIFIEDNDSATIGFRELERDINAGSIVNVDLDIIFTVQLDEIYNNEYDRNSEKTLLEAMKIVQRSGLIWNITGYKQGIEDVFSGLILEPLRFMQMQPWYVFALTVNTNYIDDSCDSLF